MRAAATLASLADVTVPFAVRAAAELGVADVLADGPRPVHEIATRTDTDERPLLRLLRALARSAVFAEPEPGTFALTPLSSLLRSDQSGGLRDACTLWPPEIRALAHLRSVIETGRSSFADLDGGDVGAHARRIIHEAEEIYDLSEFGTVVEVGGAGDLVVDVPRGDTYLLADVCRWNDDRAAAILRTIRKRMHRESRVVLLEPGGTEADLASFDLLLLATGGGRVRSAAELRDLLATAALAATRDVSSAACLLVEARPA